MRTRKELELEAFNFLRMDMQNNGISNKQLMKEIKACDTTNLIIYIAECKMQLED